MLAAVLISLVLAQPSPSLGQGRAHVQTLRSGDVKHTWLISSASPDQKLGSLANLQKASTALRGFGTETKLVSEGLAEKNGSWVYTRVVAVSSWARGLIITLTMDGQGRLLDVATAFATEEAPTTYGAYRPKVKLRLPLDDAWDVLWGGRSYEDNRHASVSDMRFALDLWQRRNGSTSSGKGTSNEDYFAWSQPVLAPADGTVVVASDGVPDNVPQKAAPGNLYGNFVVIEHGPGEFTLLGHLRAGSLMIKAGDAVVKGQRIARVGNSGMSTEPHLHFQLMDTGDWHTANGLPMVLTELERNGTVIDRVEPRRGDVVRQR